MNPDSRNLVSQIPSLTVREGTPPPSSSPLPLGAEARPDELPQVLVAGRDGPRRPPPPLLVVERVDLLALALVV